jgi:hypothetical protein
MARGSLPHGQRFTVQETYWCGAAFAGFAELEGILAAGGGIMFMALYSY